MATTQEDIKPYLTDLPGRRRGHLLRDFEPLDYGLMLTSVVLLLLAGFLHLLTLAAIALLLIVQVVPCKDGSLYALPVIWWRAFRIVLHKGVVVELDEQGNPTGGAIPREFGDLYVDDFLDFATVYDEKQGTDRMYWRVKGWRHANDDLEQRHAAQLRIAAAWRRAIAQTAQHIAYGTINGKRQFDPTEWALSLEEKVLIPEFGDDAAQSAGVRNAKRNLLRVFEKIVTKQRAKQQMLFAVTVPRPREWAKLIEDPEGFPIDELRQSTLYRIMVSLQQGLVRAGYEDVQILGIESLFRYLFGSWNVHYLTAKTVAKGEVSGYYKIPGVDPEDLPVVGPNGRLLHVRQPFPRRTVVMQSGRSGRRSKAYDTIRMEDENGASFHFVLSLESFGLKAGLPDAAYPLTVGPLPRWSLHAQVCRTASKSFDKFLLRHRRNVIVGWFANRSNVGTMYEEAEDVERIAEEKSALDKLYYSGSKPIRSGQYMVGSAASMEELNAVYDEMLAVLRDMDVTAERVTGRARLVPAYKLAVLGPNL